MRVQKVNQNYQTMQNRSKNQSFGFKLEVQTLEEEIRILSTNLNYQRVIKSLEEEGIVSQVLCGSPVRVFLNRTPKAKANFEKLREICETKKFGIFTVIAEKIKGVGKPEEEWLDFSAKALDDSSIPINNSINILTATEDDMLKFADDVEKTIGNLHASGLLSI